MVTRNWNGSLSDLPDPHILQTFEWGQVKSGFGWKPAWIAWYGSSASIHFGEFKDVPDSGQVLGMAQVLERGISIRKTTTKLKVIYVPKGPIIRDWGDERLRSRVLEDLRNYAAEQGALFIKIDPDVNQGLGVPGGREACDDPIGVSMVGELTSHGWQFSKEQVQFRNTILIDISPSEEQILARMKQKTRYNVRLAIRKGVTVKEGTIDDLGLLYQIYAETSSRDGFVIRSENYYRKVWETFINAGMATPIIAEVAGEPVAAIFIFHFQKNAWYLYGMSKEVHRDKMPNYLLQWEGIRRAKAAGCLEYDLWGAPDKFVENDPLWGVYRFKEGLGGRIVRHIGAWDLPIYPRYYILYTQILPRLVGIMRWRAMSRSPKRSSLEL